MQWRRIFCSKGFFLAIIIQILSYLYPHMDTYVFWHDTISYFGSADLLYFFLMPRANGLCIILLPFVAVMPAATLVAEDVQSGYIRFLIERTGKGKYFLIRILQAAAGGAAASIVGSMIYLGFIFIACPLDENIILSWRHSLALGSYADLAKIAYGIPIIFESILRFCIEAMTWSLVGFSFACFFHNNGTVLALTFISHYGIVYLLESYAFTYPYSPSVLSVPDISTSVPLEIYFFMQILYLAVALSTAIIIAHSASRTIGNITH